MHPTPPRPVCCWQTANQIADPRVPRHGWASLEATRQTTFIKTFVLLGTETLECLTPANGKADLEERVSHSNADAEF